MLVFYFIDDYQRSCAVHCAKPRGNLTDPNTAVRLSAALVVHTKNPYLTSSSVLVGSHAHLRCSVVSDKKQTSFKEIRHSGRKSSVNGKDAHCTCVSHETPCGPEVKPGGGGGGCECVCVCSSLSSVTASTDVELPVGQLSQWCCGSRPIMALSEHKLRPEKEGNAHETTPQHRTVTGHVFTVHL